MCESVPCWKLNSVVLILQKNGLFLLIVPSNQFVCDLFLLFFYGKLIVEKYCHKMNQILYFKKKYSKNFSCSCFFKNFSKLHECHSCTDTQTHRHTYKQTLVLYKGYSMKPIKVLSNIQSRMGSGMSVTVSRF